MEGFASICPIHLYPDLHESNQAENFQPVGTIIDITRKFGKIEGISLNTTLHLVVIVEGRSDTGGSETRNHKQLLVTARSHCSRAQSIAGHHRNDFIDGRWRLSERNTMNSVSAE
jgi:hypothetical protein